MSSWRDLLDQARSLGGYVAGAAKLAASRHVRAEGRRLYLSDAALGRSTQLLASLVAPGWEVSVTPQDGGHLVQASADGRRLSAVVVLEAVRIADGKIRVDVSTPAGIDLPNRPAAELLAATVARLFGGTWMGRKILSAATPDWMMWDGARATLETGLEAIPIVGTRLSSLTVNAVARTGDGGVWLELDRDGVAAELVMVATRSALDHLGVSAPPGAARTE